MIEQYNVVQVRDGGGYSGLSKSFSTHEEALEYIKDMLKYHKTSFLIEKLYTNKKEN